MDHHSVKRTPNKRKPNQRRKKEAGKVIDRRKDECVEKVQEQAEHEGLCSSEKGGAAKQSAGDVQKNPRGRSPRETKKDEGTKKIKSPDGEPAIKDCIEGPRLLVVSYIVNRIYRCLIT